MAKRKLTAKQAVFVDEYLVDGNATRSAIAAGYSKRSAKSQGARLLTNANLAAAITEAMSARSERTQITADQVLEELAKLGFSNMLNYISAQDDGTAYVDLSKLDRDQAAAITEVTVDSYWEGKGDEAERVKRVKFKLADKRASLELLGKHLGMFNKLVLAGDEKNPVRVVPDLSGLSDAEVKQFIKIRKKLTDGSSPGA